MYIYLDTIPQHEGQTDRWTDRSGKSRCIVEIYGQPLSRE